MVDVVCCLLFAFGDWQISQLVASWFSVGVSEWSSKFRKSQ